MSSTGFQRRALLAALAAVFAMLPVYSAFAVPSQAEVGAGRERVAGAVRRLAEARQRQAAVDERVARTSERLDRIVAEQREGREQLASRVGAMYRSGDSGFVSVLLGAESFADFASRWRLLAEVNREDAEELERLESSRVQLLDAAGDLLRLQEDSARSADAIERELARARKELAADEAALSAYEEQVAKDAASRARTRTGSQKTAAEPVEAAQAKAPEQTRSSRREAGGEQGQSGKGAWRTAIASHYGINFTGRGASGKKIGPYSMMVAHKTLPFGTLVEFEYRGERALARVEDRGPHVAGRQFDLGPGVTRVLGFRGVDEVRYRVIER